MVVDPALAPEATPVPEVIVATEELLLLHVPLPVISLSVVVDPGQTLVFPVIAAGSGFTVNVLVTSDPHPVE